MKYGKCNVSYRSCIDKLCYELQKLMFSFFMEIYFLGSLEFKPELKANLK